MHARKVVTRRLTDSRRSVTGRVFAGVAVVGFSKPSKVWNMVVAQNDGIKGTDHIVRVSANYCRGIIGGDEEGVVRCWCLTITQIGGEGA